MVTIDLNDEKTKLKLLSILYSNYNGDIPNNEVEEEVNKQLDNSNTDPIVLRAINSSELNNKQVAISTLSSDQFTRYIVEGTCDGSITVNDKNVWHEGSLRHYVCGIFDSRNDDYYKNGYIPNFTNGSLPLGKRTDVTWQWSLWGWDGDSALRSIDVNIPVELLENSNNASATLSGCKNHMLICMCVIDGPDIVAGTVEPKIANKNSAFCITNQLRQNIRGSGNYFIRNFKLPLCYRPAFFIKDNIKSKNLYY